MNYEFDYKIDPFDMMLISLKGIYHSMIGVVNIVFTFATLALLFRFWNDIDFFLKFILMVCVLIFPVFQPLLIYNRARKQINNIAQIKLKFDNKGFNIITEDKVLALPWKKIKRISKNNRAIVIYISDKNGYILTKKLLDDNFENLYAYILKKI